MKIGIDIRNIGKNRTGDEAVFLNLVKNLAKIDKINSYKLFTDIKDKEKLEKIKKDLEIENSDNFELVPLLAKNRFSWNFWTLQKYLRENPVDAYLTQYITPWFVPKKINPHTKNPIKRFYKKWHDKYFGVGVKIYTVIHDISFNFFPRLIKFSDLLFLKLLIPLSLRRADKIIAVSDFTRGQIVDYYNISPKKVFTVHNAAGDNQTDLLEERIADAKEKYKLPEKYILYLGTLQPRKNLPILIEAYAQLPAEIKTEFKLVLAGGKGHNFDVRIEKTAEKYKLSDDIIFPGYIQEEDKAAVMAGADIFCFPSLYEGFGMPILEAMNLGVPVVASSIPPHREVAGESILYFNPVRADELAQRLQTLILGKDLKEKLIKIGLERAQNFSWTKSAQKYLEIFAMSD